MTDFTPIVQGVIIIAIGLLTALLIPFLKSKLSTEQWAWLTSVVGILVKSAEMLFPKKGEGTNKTAYVKNYLNKHGFIVDDEKLEALIEAAVCEINRTQH